MAWRNRFLALSIAGALCALIAAPLSASTDREGDAKAGEKVFYDQAFSATAASIPLMLFEALPDLDPAYTPEALSRKYGLLYREGRALPIGFVTASAMGMERLSFNCSMCHTGIVNGKQTPGMPNRDLRVQDFEEDFMAMLASPGFTADKVVAAVKKRRPTLSLADEANLRLWLGVARWQASSRKPSPHRGGPGRYDLMGSFKTRLKLPAHDFNAQMDIAPLFGQRTIQRYPRDGAIGGDQDLVRYLIVKISGDNTPLKDGRPPQWVRDLNAFMHDFEPPVYPLAVDRAQAARGRQVFKNTCSPCHGSYEAYDERHPNGIIPMGVLGTDPNRVRVWDDAAIRYVKQDALMKRLDLQPGVGLMPPSLKGVWATAPYLHNGSVPTLYDVLNPATRPAVFYRGGEHFDPLKVGIATIDKPADDRQFRYDTRLSGNGNMGHPFGVPLSDAQRWDVVEYLKTI
jgi:mono/diheme cytochrome c family protein